MFIDFSLEFPPCLCYTILRINHAILDKRGVVNERKLEGDNEAEVSASIIES